LYKKCNKTLEKMDAIAHQLNLSNNKILLEIWNKPPDKSAATKYKMIE
jgi:hypothetical protein